mgnify:CR=1 FL=1
MRNILITLVIIMAFGTTAAGNVMMAEETDTVITHDPAEYITGTLPVMHIYTDVNFDGSTDVIDVNIIIGTILGNN